jgi:hypothetical protein
VWAAGLFDFASALGFDLPGVGVDILMGGSGDVDPCSSLMRIQTRVKTTETKARPTASANPASKSKREGHAEGEKIYHALE